MTKKKPVRGRPKLPPGAARELFSLRITRQEREKIELAARASGEKASRWARNYLLSFGAGKNLSEAKSTDRAGCICSCCT
jgi:hypothetical protein